MMHTLPAIFKAQHRSINKSQSSRTVGFEMTGPGEVGAPAPSQPLSSPPSCCSFLLPPQNASVSVGEKAFCFLSPVSFVTDPVFSSASTGFVCESFPGARTICTQTVLKPSSQVSGGWILVVWTTGPHFVGKELYIRKLCNFPSNYHCFFQFYCVQSLT